MAVSLGQNYLLDFCHDFIGVSAACGLHTPGESQRPGLDLSEKETLYKGKYMISRKYII